MLEIMNKRIITLLVLVGLLASLVTFNWWLRTTPVGHWQGQHLHWNYAFHMIFILLPLLLVGFNRSRASSYGLTMSNWRMDLLVGVALAIPLFALPFVADILFGTLTLTPEAAPRIANTLLFQFLFVGFAEELLFRGLFQGELNRVFGRPFSIGSTRFGFGLLATSLLFGLVHLLNPFNPIIGKLSLDWGSFAGTTLFALFAGLIRERTGGLIAVTLFHFGFGLFPAMFVVSNHSGFAMLLSWVISLIWLLLYLFKKRRQVQPGLQFENSTQGAGEAEPMRAADLGR